jgi:uncharacterized repeat protein (TIGR02543 family)
MSRADVRQMTAELRSVAVKTLPRDIYNIMTSETVMAQGSAKLEECSEENCVIALGNMIGADYIVRGIMSKLGNSLTMAVEMYETEDGNLVASSGLVRAANIADLVDKTAAVCADMYRAFLSAQGSAKKARLTHTVTVAVNPVGGGSVLRDPDQTYYAPGTSVSITAVPASGYVFTGWSGSSTSKKATLAGPIDRDLTLTANFQYIQRTYALTTTASPTGGGSVSRIPDKEAYTSGEQVTVTATAESGYTFIGWTGLTAGRSNRLTVIMDGDKAVTANFYRQSVAPTAAQNARGTASDWGDADAERESMTGFSLGYNFFPSKKGHKAVQLGIVRSLPISERVVSLNAEVDAWVGIADRSDNEESTGFFGITVPLTFLFQLSFLSLEAGVDGDVLFGGGDEAMFNAGFVVGAGGFNSKHSRRYFFRYCGGYSYGKFVVGMLWLF